jgi:hypothetical protein
MSEVFVWGDIAAGAVIARCMVMAAAEKKENRNVVMED